jgi:hypothetical protein
MISSSVPDLDASFTPSSGLSVKGSSAVSNAKPLCRLGVSKSFPTGRLTLRGSVKGQFKVIRGTPPSCSQKKHQMVRFSSDRVPYVLLIPRGEVPQSQLPDTSWPVRYCRCTYECIVLNVAFITYLFTPLEWKYASRSRRRATDRVEAATDRLARRIVLGDNDYRDHNNYYLDNNTIRRAPSTSFSAVKHDTSTSQIKKVWESEAILKTRYSYARAPHPDSNTWSDVGGAEIEEDIEAENEV